MTTGVKSDWIGNCIGSLYRHTMEMEQMMACLLDEIRTNQTKADTNLKEMKEEMTTRLKAKIDTNQEKTIVKLDAHHERMMTRMDYQLEKMVACLEKRRPRIWRQIQKK
jgi:23S rRNA pseudoU1915 N3-methylase RlmH